MPAPAHAVRPTTSMSMASRSRTSMTRPPATVEWPAPLWPPLRTAISTPASRAVVTAKATSWALAADDEAGPLVDGTGHHDPHLVVVGVVGGHDAAFEARAQRFQVDGGGVRSGGHARVSCARSDGVGGRRGWSSPAAARPGSSRGPATGCCRLGSSPGVRVLARRRDVPQQNEDHEGHAEGDDEADARRRDHAADERGLGHAEHGRPAAPAGRRRPPPRHRACRWPHRPRPAGCRPAASWRSRRGRWPPRCCPGWRYPAPRRAPRRSRRCRGGAGPLGRRRAHDELGGQPEHRGEAQGDDQRRADHHGQPVGAADLGQHGQPDGGHDQAGAHQSSRPH